MHQSTKLKIEFMEHLDSFVADYIEDGNMDLLYFDFLHIKPKAYGRFTVDLSPYTHILEQY